MAEIKTTEKPKDSNLEKRTVNIDGKDEEIDWDKNLGGPVYRVPTQIIHETKKSGPSDD